MEKKGKKNITKSIKTLQERLGEYYRNLSRDKKIEKKLC